jgi:hypothetical protein
MFAGYFTLFAAFSQGGKFWGFEIGGFGDWEVVDERFSKNLKIQKSKNGIISKR